MSSLDIVEHPYVKVVVFIFLVVYASLARPDLPPFMVNLFENPIFKLLVLALIVYRGNKDPQMALMIAIAFMVTLNLISEQKTKETFRQVEGFRQAYMNQ